VTTFTSQLLQWPLARAFANGAIGTIITSFDVWASRLPKIEIHGSRGSLLVPDPNMFGGQVWLRKAEERDWQEVPLVSGHVENSRGIGVAEMAAAMDAGRPHRCSGELAFHVLDIMHAFHDSSVTRHFATLRSSCESPAPLF